MAEDHEMKFLVYQLIPNVMISTTSTETKQNLRIESFENVTKEIIEHLTQAVLMKMFRNAGTWRRYVRENRDDFFSTEDRFLSRVLYAVHIINSRTRGIYERFIEVIATVLSIAYFTYKSNIKILEYSPQILMVFFDSVLKKLFYKRGGWKQLAKYIKTQEYIHCFEQIDNLALQPDDVTLKIALEGAKIVESYKPNIPHQPIVVTPGEVQNHALTAKLVKKVMKAHEKGPPLRRCIFPRRGSDYMWCNSITNSIGRKVFVRFTKELEMEIVAENYMRCRPLGSTENQRDFDCGIREDSEDLRLPEKCLLNTHSDNDIEVSFLDIINDIGCIFSTVKSILDFLVIER
ncbi:hypothetical protein CEXT_301721 [Caerostris extrusa]|uniref:Uncharacterized protein n=1 Tax=Caerostris extrusa TaxID=172846 RepID=A0AAV4S3X4_CAEEX|nr:hypothetical protein CEXT_301721 [Caerostris extrusa]